MPDLPSTGEFATAPGDLVIWDLRRAGGHRMDIMFAVMFGIISNNAFVQHTLFKLWLLRHLLVADHCMLHLPTVLV